MRLLAGTEPLTETHDTTRFDCGHPDLTNWLRETALLAQKKHSSRVFVAHRGGRVVGYYALSMAQAHRAEAPRVLRAGVPQVIPCVLLGRLAVDLSEQGEGLGKALVKDAIGRAARAALNVGALAMLVHAKDQRARAFYERIDFIPSPTNPLHLYLPMRDILKAMS